LIAILFWRNCNVWIQCAAWMKEMNSLVPMDFYIMSCYYVFEVEAKYPNVMTEEDRQTKYTRENQ
jgi:hypothetical protein